MAQGLEKYLLTHLENFLFDSPISPWFHTNGSLTVLSSSVPKPHRDCEYHKEGFLFTSLRTLHPHLNILHQQAHVFLREWCLTNTVITWNFVWTWYEFCMFSVLSIIGYMHKVVFRLHSMLTITGNNNEMRCSSWSTGIRQVLINYSSIMPSIRTCIIQLRLKLKIFICFMKK